MKKMITIITSPSEFRQGDFWSKDLRIVWKNDEPIFVMKDVCKVLEIRHHRDAFMRLEKYERESVILDTLGGPQEVSAVTESGLYHLTFMSRKPVAVAFRRWVTSEVLPALRRHGYYAIRGNGVNSDPTTFIYETARHYLHNRGLEHLSASGLSLRCSNLCKAQEIEPVHSWSGTLYPVHFLDMAVKGRDQNATRGPAIPEKPDIIKFDLACA